MINMGNMMIMLQNPLEVQINFEFTKWLNEKYTAKFYIGENLYHFITFQFNSKEIFLNEQNFHWIQWVQQIRGVW